MCLKTVLFICAIFVLVFVAAGCRSASPGVSESVLDHQRQVTELEARNRELETRIERYDSAVSRGVTELRTITDRAGRVDGSIDELIQLFDEYQRGVEQLIRDYYAAAGTTQPIN